MKNPDPDKFDYKEHRDGFMVSSALYSRSGCHRFTLMRDWSMESQDMLESFIPEQHKRAQFIGLNPSTATETANDPTVTRCIKRARMLGCSSFYMTNLFPWRSTDPSGLDGKTEDYVRENLEILLKVAEGASIVICAWGSAHARAWSRGCDVREAFEKAGIGHKLHALKVNLDGSPAHPLYLPFTLKPIPYRIDVEDLLNY